MSNKRTFDEIITKFFLNTCRPRPQISKHAVQALVWHAMLTNLHTPDDKEADAIPMLTGSVAEFYIEPILPHVGDIDVMFHHSTELAIPRGHPPPTQLPAEFSNYVQVFEIVDSHLPGYVYLELRYLLTECADDVIEYDHGEYLSNIGYDPETYLPNLFIDSHASYIHGPAVFTDHSDTPSMLSVDRVPCVRCLSWPSQAADWSTRHRNYDWPDSATVDRVVNNGCDVVGVAHRQCKHELMGKLQHRLSFSRAEIVLINSWMPVQQIVYHMLRVFMKNELLADSGNNSEACALSNYHVKTLMMWACELKLSSFWTNDLNLIRICVELLHTLSAWLTDARCQHYFISNCNLIDNSLDVEVIAGQLKSTHKALLSTWFINNYVCKCFMLCPESVSSLFSDFGTNRNLHNAISAVVNWRKNTDLNNMWDAFQFGEMSVVFMVSNYSLTIRSCTFWMTEFAKRDVRLLIHFTAVTFLHVAYKTSSIGFTEELLDFSATIAGQFISRRRHSSQCSSELSLSKATKLMKVIANSSRSTMQLIEIELSKAYLYRALRCKDSDSDSICCLTNVYLAVLYYTTRQR